MQSDYKGFSITIDKGNMHQFYVEDLNEHYNTLGGAEVAIDLHIKKANKFERIPVIYQGRWGDNFGKGEITSVVKHGHMWVSKEKGGREKITGHCFCCSATKENNDIISQALVLRENAKKLEGDARELLKTVNKTEITELLEKYTPKH